MSPSRSLEAARALIADKADWCVGSQLNEHGQRCALGALRVAVCHHPTYRGLPAYEYLRRACDALYEKRSIIEVNDCLGHEAMIAAYDVAISLARTDEEQGLAPPEREEGP